VKPGPVEAGLSGESSVKAGAFKSLYGSAAVVSINSAASTQTVTNPMPGYQDVNAWYTDEQHSMNVAAVTVGSDGLASASAPGRAMISFLFKATRNGLVV
jgi:hypothetical protein